MEKKKTVMAQKRKAKKARAVKKQKNVGRKKPIKLSAKKAQALAHKIAEDVQMPLPLDEFEGMEAPQHVDESDPGFEVDETDPDDDNESFF